MAKEKDKNSGGKVAKTLLTLSLGGALLASPVFLSGCEGEPGKNGENGVRWYTGEANPTISGNEEYNWGVNGDFYLDTDDLYLYQKINGAWTPVGSIRGDRGSAWLSGAENPNEYTNALLGDVYLNTESLELFKLTTAGWESLGVIKGEEGVGVKDISYSNEVDEDGNVVLTITYTFTDKSKKVITTYPYAEIFAGKVMSIQNAIDVAPVGATIKLNADVQVTSAINVDKKITIDLNGHKLYTDEQEVEAGQEPENWSMFNVVENGELEIINSVVYTESAGSASAMGVGNSLVDSMPEGFGILASLDSYATIFNVNGGKVVINDENTGILVAGSIANVESGDVVLNDGQYMYYGSEEAPEVFVSADENASIVVNGGYFVGFNPAKVGANGNNFMAENMIIVTEFDDEVGYINMPVETDEAVDYLANGYLAGTEVNITLADDMILQDVLKLTNVNLKIDTNGYTIKVADNCAGYGIIVDADATLTIYGGGKVVSNYEGAWSEEVTHGLIKANGALHLKDLTLKNGTQECSALKISEVSQLENVTINAKYSAGVEVYSNVTFNNCTINQTGDYYNSHEWMQAAIGLGHNGTAIINGGSYSSVNGYALAVWSSGGNIVVNGGSIDGTIKKYDLGLGTYPDASASIVVAGGTFKNFNPANNGEVVELAQGTKVTSKAEGDDTYYTVTLFDVAENLKENMDAGVSELIAKAYNITNATGAKQYLSIDELNEMLGEGNELANYYVALGTVNIDATTIKIGRDIIAIDQIADISLGNNYFLRDKIVKIEDGVLYVSAVVLAVDTQNIENVEINGVEFDFTALDSVNALANTSVAFNHTNTVTPGETANEYELNITNGTAMLAIGYEQAERTDIVATRKAHSTGKVTYGLTSLDAVSGNYVLGLYPIGWVTEITDAVVESYAGISMDYSIYVAGKGVADFKLNYNVSKPVQE